MAKSRRVVITGMGAVSSIGTGLEEITKNLRAGRSGIVHLPEWSEMGIASQVAGVPEAQPESPLVDRRQSKNAGSAGKMALRASWEALETAGLDFRTLRGERIAVIIGSGSGSPRANYLANRAIETHRSTRRVNPFTVPHAMCSTGAANVCVALGLRGESWAVSSACSTGSHALGLARMMIQTGRYQQVLAGATEEVSWCESGAFDAMRALSRGFNDRPEQASRPFDKSRDGFVIAGGAGILLVEDLDFARARGATILAEFIGFGANSDGRDMVVPWPEGAVSVMREALDDASLPAEAVDYVNAHGTSTPQGDPSEARAMQILFGDRQPYISSTKSITGHALSAAGSLEAIYTVQMLREGFLSPSRNVDELDESCAHLALVREGGKSYAPRIALSNSFGFGGTNATLVLRAWRDDDA